MSFFTTHEKYIEYCSIGKKIYRKCHDIKKIVISRSWIPKKAKK